MIKKIKKVKEFGVFKNFVGDQLPEFAKLNLIFGWNYSGKTTLSRIFRCLEQGKLHEDYLSAYFCIEGENELYDSSFSNKPNIRVFNSDFIKENLKWEGEGIDPIIILGEKNIDLQEKLNKVERELFSTTEELEKINYRKEEIDREIKSALTNKAREITGLLNLGRNFDRDHLIGLLDNNRNNIEGCFLGFEELEKVKSEAYSGEIKPEIPNLIYLDQDTASILNECKSALDHQAASTKKIQKLLEDKLLSSWIQTGKKIHEGKTICEFCGNILPPDLISVLNEHFSEDLENLQSTIDGLINKLSANKTKAITTNNLPAETAFYPGDLKDKYLLKRELFQKELRLYAGVFDELIGALELKKEKPFDIISLPNMNYENKDLNSILEELNDLVSQNNSRTKRFNEVKSKAVGVLKLHFAAEFNASNKYFEKLEQKENLQIEIEQLNKLVAIKESEASQIRELVDESFEGAERIKDNLSIFFSKDDIQIKPTQDKKFQLMRGDQIAKNLSEGEKTAIAFSYFMTKLEENNNPLSETIVYIDDPVSSLDSNHLFRVYSFIKNSFYQKGNRSEPKHVFLCKQLFVSTHNLEFHRLFVDWLNSLKEKNRKFYMLEHLRSEERNESLLKVNSELIVKYKSEYAYLFSILFSFTKDPFSTTDLLYHLPNIARRFVETFLHFKYLSSVNIDNDIDRLISDPVKCEATRKFLHFYSHSLTAIKIVKFADLNECKVIIPVILDSVKAADPEHYQSLVDIVESIKS